LALQLGHRRSLDLDLFSERPWAWARITPALSSAGEVVVDRQEPGTFVGSVGGVRVSLFHYPYVLLGEPAPTRFGIPLASLTDIGCMKLVAVSQRGSRKDFIDLYYLAQGGVGIREILGALARKMPGVHYNPVHLIRALAYFDDAEAEPDPEMLVDYEWQAVKAYCTQQSRAMLDEIQDE
ncbi:MAG: nucleotidyl transferase AbiEii/AbiGii toxin family protein, partial [Actinomycetota bacterium]|nr:nucleotidyl transferase AbiEii/AbiGii toxin family protein [Actinomycetota bacterium]